MAHRCWTLTGFFLAIWLGLMVAGRSRFFHDPGTFWHTVVGEQMLRTGHLVYHDSFSFTYAGQRWSPHQWLGECIMALLHRIDGLDTLLLATVTLLACLYTWLAHRLLRCGLHWSLTAVVVGLVIATSSSHFHIRPHIGTMLCMGLVYGFLCDFEARAIAIKRMLWLVPIFILWTNIHGGMLGGLGTMALAFGGWVLLWLLRASGPIQGLRQALTFAALLLACGLTAYVNPYGARLPQIWLEIMNADLPRIIIEHAPLDPSKPDGWIVIVLVSIYGLALIGIFPNRPRITWLLPLLWFYLTCNRIRHAPLFAITAGIALADMIPHTRWAAWLASKGSDLFQFPSQMAPGPRWRWLAALVPIAVVGSALFLQVRQMPLPVLGHGWAKLDPDYWPMELLPELRACQNAQTDDTPIFNEYLFGGFLIYETPGFRVFVDDRCELYGDRWLEKYVESEKKGTAEFLRSWHFDLALTSTGSGYDQYFAASSEWESKARSETATLYQRRKSQESMQSVVR